MRTSRLSIRILAATLAVILASIGRAEQPASAATIQVFNTGDAGAGSLRAAITQANTTDAHDTITFNIAGAGPHVIAPLTLLPNITKPLTIDGYCATCGATMNTAPFGQPMNASLKIVLSGANVPGTPVGLLFLNANAAGVGSSVRGLVVQNWAGTGIAIVNGLVPEPYVITGNMIGTDPTGTIGAPNGTGVYYSSGNTGTVRIGGATAADRNLISGNTSGGIGFGDGVNHLVTGNYLGTKANGNEALANGSAGGGSNISMSATNGVTIGGLLPEERNLISGATGSGLHTASAVNLSIINNLIGTNALGTAAIPNLYGISLGSSTNVSVGTAAPGSGNVVSGNKQGELVVSGGSGHSLRRNLIGLNAAGTADLPNGFPGFFVSGVIAVSTTNLRIGEAGAGNIIAGNSFYGIEAQNPLTMTIAGNTIGLPGIPNVVAGIGITDATAAIGSTLPADKNTISSNSGPGIRVTGNAAKVTVGINQIENNSGLPIDVLPLGQGANDPGDGDTGPNDRLNYPVVMAVLAGVTTSIASVHLDLPPSIQARLYFYSGTTCPSGIPQLEEAVLVVNQPSGLTGTVNLTVDLATVLAVGSFLSAVVEDMTNAVASEASPCVEVEAAPPAPAITKLAPPSVMADGPAFPLMIVGTNFWPTDRITYGGTDLGAPTSTSATHHVVNVPTDLVENAGEFTVKVEDTLLDRGFGTAQFTVRFRSSSDADCNDLVTTNDALAVLRILVGLTTNIPLSCQDQVTPPGDADLSGVLDIRDPLYIRQVAAGILPQ